MYAPDLIEQQDDGTIKYTYQMTSERNNVLFLLSATCKVRNVFGRHIGHDSVPIRDYEVINDQGMMCVRVPKVSFDLVYIIAEEL